MMDNVERAREIFRKLEDGSTGRAAEIAKRAFCIQDMLTRN